MPELPDISAYLTALEPRILGQTLDEVRVAGPLLVRTWEPRLEAAHGRQVVGLRRIGKRIAIGLEGDLWLVLHLMIAGRLHWRAAGSQTAGPQNKPKLGGKRNLAAFDFSSGSLTLTEAGSKRRASLHVLGGEQALREIDPGGIEPLACTRDQFRAALSQENRALKRALMDPRLVSGIGNAYSDEILHAAQLSPIALTHKLTDAQWDRLFTATRTTLTAWIDRLAEQARRGFPEKVTAFRPEMAAHGRFGEPCPRCGQPIQRIRYADNETNYCPRCQTEGKLLADRGLSRLLGKDWPKTLEELEARKRK